MACSTFDAPAAGNFFDNPPGEAKSKGVRMPY
jgi:hypothetical protein